MVGRIQSSKRALLKACIVGTDPVAVVQRKYLMFLHSFEAEGKGNELSPLCSVSNTEMRVFSSTRSWAGYLSSISRNGDEMKGGSNWNTFPKKIVIDLLEHLLVHFPFPNFLLD